MEAEQNPFLISQSNLKYELTSGRDSALLSSLFNFENLKSKTVITKLTHQVLNRQHECTDQLRP